jgi:FlaA1/EpsC-like NDP-sugar epimerase
LILSAVSNNFGNKIILVTGEGGFIWRELQANAVNKET